MGPRIRKGSRAWGGEGSGGSGVGLEPKRVRHRGARKEGLCVRQGVQGETKTSCIVWCVHGWWVLPLPWPASLGSQELRSSTGSQASVHSRARVAVFGGPSAPDVPGPRRSWQRGGLQDFEASV